MMKLVHFIAVSGVLAALVPLAEADDRNEKVRLRERALAEFEEQRRAEEIRKLLQAREIVVCAPVGPEGFVIREVLRGGSEVGGYWNDGTFPNGPVLAYELWEPGGLDAGGGTISVSGHFRIDREGRVVLSRSPRVTVTLVELRRLLEAKSE